jgi:thioredoxin reductase
MKTLGTVIVGGGPAGLSILLAARRSNLLQELVEKGLKII